MRGVEVEGAEDEEGELPEKAAEREPGEESGGRKTTRMHHSHQPCEEEKAEEMTDVPFCRWCRHRIIGGREEDCCQNDR